MEKPTDFYGWGQRPVPQQVASSVGLGEAVSPREKYSVFLALGYSF